MQLLGEKYLSIKKRSASDETDTVVKKACTEQKDESKIGGIGEFIRYLPDAKMDEARDFLHFVLPFFGDTLQPKVVLKRQCYDTLWEESIKYLEMQRGVTDRLLS